MKILFICSGNAFRSPLAEALLKKYRSIAEVDSAGTNPTVAPAIAESTKEYLFKEHARQYLKQDPEGLNEKEIENYDLIITMEKRHKEIVISKCPECEDKIVVWNIQDPYFRPQDTERIFNQIKKKVKELANSLRSN